jgi:ADP-heptose:LPS heptosyltransferase
MRGCLLTERVHFDPGRHEVRNFLAHLPMSAEDTGPARREVCFWPTDAEDQRARSLTASLPAGRRLLVHAPAAHPAKMWRPEAWSHLLGKLREEGYVLIASGSPEDSRLYSEIGVEFELDLCRAGTTLRDNVAVYGHCDLAVCVDSGPMHLAAAMGIPGVALFGPSDPNRWQPWSDSWRVTQGLPELRPAEVHRQLRELESDLASARR